MRQPFHIAVLWLMKYDGSGLLTGGLERWCRDLALLAASKGYSVTVYQKAETTFERPLAEHVRVVGVACPLRFTGNWKLARWLEKNVKPDDPIVFVSQELALSPRLNRAAAVNHGIWWDGDFPWWKRWLNKRLQYRLLLRLRGTICVDTNYINWCHAELPRRQSWEQKLWYVPNYADLDQFRPAPAVATRKGPLVVLFPRRVMGKSLVRDERGAGLLLQAVKVLETRGVRTRLLFAGRGQLQEAIRQWAADQGMADRVEVFESSLDDMPEVYARADIVVVPTLAHEGTSLSAIEAMASGKPTVVSHIGGLGNIVIDGLNGHVCDLSPTSLADAIEEAARRRCLGTPAVLEAYRQSLGKPRWEKKVWSLLQTSLELPG